MLNYSGAGGGHTCGKMLTCFGRLRPKARLSCATRHMPPMKAGCRDRSGCSLAVWDRSFVVVVVMVIQFSSSNLPICLSYFDIQCLPPCAKMDMAVMVIALVLPQLKTLPGLSFFMVVIGQASYLDYGCFNEERAWPCDRTTLLDATSTA